MIAYNLNSAKAANKLIRACEKYQDVADINVNHGRTTVDGGSILGVYSLIGNYVTVEPLTDDEEIIGKLREELSE